MYTDNLVVNQHNNSLSIDVDSHVHCHCLNIVEIIIIFVLFNLSVPTTITQTPKDVSVTQGESGIFHCKARGHPAPHIAWASGPNGDRPIPSEERFRILPSGSLVVGRVNFTDQGMYRCVASNPAGSAAAAATLNVRGKDPVKPVTNLILLTVTAYSCLKDAVLKVLVSPPGLAYSCLNNPDPDGL